MAGDLTRAVDRPYVTEDTRASARRYLSRNGCDDLLPILGLVESPQPEAPRCVNCGEPTGHKRNPPRCQRRACLAAVKAKRSDGDA